MWVSSPLCHPCSSWELSNQLKYSTFAKIFQVSSVKRKVNSDWVFISPKRFLISCLHDQCMHMQCNNFVSSFVHTLMWTHLSSNQSMCTSCLSMYVSHFSFYGELTSLLHWNKVHKEFTFHCKKLLMRFAKTQSVELLINLYRQPLANQFAFLCWFSWSARWAIIFLW